MALTDGELTLLGLLAEQPRHGYDLEKVIAERGIRAWTALGFSSIYYVLDKLAKRGLVEPVSAPTSAKSRVPFRVTALGLEECATATREALETLTPVHARVLVAMANSPLLPDAEIVAGLTRRLSALRDQLVDVRATRSEQEPLPMNASAIFDHGEAMLTADIHWTETTLSTLTQEKYDIKKVHKALYAPSAKDFTVVDVPEIQYIAVDGEGDPNTSEAYVQAVEALYGVAYAVKFASRKTRDFVVGPLEGLWRAADPAAFVARDKGSWRWTMMISQPPWVTEDVVRTAVAGAARKKPNPALGEVRMLTLVEGTCVQILHIGPYDDETSTLDRLHNHHMPAHGLTFNGDHHEIYLSDARRTPPAKLRTVLRQPVRSDA